LIHKVKNIREDEGKRGERRMRRRRRGEDEEK